MSSYSQSLNWDGKELASISKYCESNYYKYNDQGIRTQKTTGTCSGSKTTKYTLSGNLVIMESWGTNVNQKIYYTYDVDGSLISFKYNNNEYFYIRNLQGDIIKIIDISGNVLVTYSYDAFGNTLNTTDTSGISLSIINPYRYRGYRYDLETGFYYLQSRYYNPQIGRFISPDSINYLNPMSNSGENLYTYTANNPVNLIDPDGFKPLPWWGNLMIGVGIITILAVATVLTAGIAGISISAAFAAGFTGVSLGSGIAATAATILSSAFAGAVIGSTTSMLAAGILSAVTGASSKEILNTASTSFMFGAVLGAFSGFISPIQMSINESINIAIHVGVNSAASVTAYLGQSAYINGNLNNISALGLTIALISGGSAGNLSNSISSIGYYNYLGVQASMFFDYVNQYRYL